MASRFDDLFSSTLGGKKKAVDTSGGVYTGAYERVNVQAENQYHLRVFAHKGRVVAVYYGDRPLPFVVENVEPNQVVTLQSAYRQGLAGLIDRIALRVAKR